LDGIGLKVIDFGGLGLAATSMRALEHGSHGRCDSPTWSGQGREHQTHPTCLHRAGHDGGCIGVGVVAEGAPLSRASKVGAD